MCVGKLESITTSIPPSAEPKEPPSPTQWKTSDFVIRLIGRSTLQGIPLGMMAGFGLVITAILAPAIAPTALIIGTVAFGIIFGGFIIGNIQDLLKEGPPVDRPNRYRPNKYEDYPL